MRYGNRKANTSDDVENLLASSCIRTWTQLNTRVIESPQNVCTIIRKTKYREEVIVKCSVYGADSRTIYLARFISKETLPFARALRTGDLISLDECRIEEHCGRKEKQLLVKSASKITASHP